MATRVDGGHGDELITWWHEDSITEKRELQPEEDRRVVRSPFFEVSVWTAAEPEETDRSQKPFPYFSWPRMGRQKWGYSKDDGAEDFERNHCTCTWAHFLYSTDVWVEVTLLGDADHPNIAEEILVRPRKMSEQTEGGYWRPEKSGKNAVKIKIPYSAEGLRFSLEFSWETLQLSQGRFCPLECLRVFMGKSIRFFDRRSLDHGEFRGT